MRQQEVQCEFNLRLWLCIMIAALAIFPAQAAEQAEEAEAAVDQVEVRRVHPRIYALFSAGVSHLNAGQLTEALEAFRAVTVHDPLSGNAWYYKSGIYRRIAQNDQVERCLRQALTSQPDNHRFLHELGLHLYSEGELDAGIELRMRAAKLAIADEDLQTAEGIYRMIARDHLRVNNVDDATEVIKLAIEISYDPEPLGTMLANIYRSRENWLGTIEAYTMLLDRTGKPEYFSRIGLALEELERWDEAVAAYEALIRAQPDDIDNYPIIVRAMEAARRGNRVEKAKEFLEKSIQLLNQAVAKGENDPQLYSRLAALLGRAGENERAIEILTSGLKHAEGAQAVEMHATLGSALLAEHRPLEAEAAYLSGLAIDPSNHVLREQLGRLYFNLMRYQDAADAYRRAVDLASGRAEIMYRAALVEIYKRMGRYSDAETQQRQVIRLVPNYPNAWSELAGVLIKAERYDEAADAVRKAIEQGTDSPLLVLSWHATLAEVYAAMEDDAKHREHYDKIVELARNMGAPVAVAYALAETNFLDPAINILTTGLDTFEDQRSNAMGLLAELYMRQQKLDEAEAVMELLLKEYSEDPMAYRSLTHFLGKQKRYDEAIQALEKAAALSDDGNRLMTDLPKAAILDQMGRDDEAERLYQSLLLQHPDDPTINNNYSYFLATRGRDLERAKAMVTKALRQMPGNSAFLDTLGWVLYKAGNYEGALIQISQAYEKEPGAEVAEHLGDVLYKLGRTSLAVEKWRQALELDPNNAELAEKLQQATER